MATVDIPFLGKVPNPLATDPNAAVVAAEKELQAAQEKLAAAKQAATPPAGTVPGNTVDGVNGGRRKRKTRRGGKKRKSTRSRK